MGQAATVAAAFAMIMFITGIAVLVTTSVSSLDILSEAMGLQSDRQETLINERCQINSLRIDSNQVARFNITNTGNTGIMARDFDKCDLILTYTVSGTHETRWLEYDPEHALSYGWSVNRVFFKGEEDEAINPLDKTSYSYGVWDPDEKLEVRLQVGVVVDDFDYVSFTTPNGVKSAHSFSLDYEIGKTILPSGSDEVWVRHHLGRTPVNVVLTPRSEPNKYWVSNVNSTHFLINMDKKTLLDIPFYWRIE